MRKWQRANRAGAEIWSGSVEQVSSLMWSHSPLALSQDMAGGRSVRARPFANESPWTDHCRYERPHDVRPPVGL